LAGCSERDRANPFDPRNHETRGAPVGFVALAGDGRVDLSWQVVQGQGLVGYQLYRRTAGQTTFEPLSSLLSPTTSRYYDLGLLNGLDHSYRLYYVFDTGLGGHPAEDTATPGQVKPWVIDEELGTLSRLTPDGRHVAFVRSGFVGPTGVGVDSASGQVWVSDGFGRRLTVLDPASGKTVDLPGLLALPSTLAVNSIDHSAWICDEVGDAVYQFSPSLTPILLPLQGIQTPIGVAVDPRDGSVWICERGASRVRRYGASHDLRWRVAVDRPSRIAVDSFTGKGWTTSFENGQVVRITDAGSVDDTFPGFAGPIGLAVDPRRGRIWVADARANQVVILDRGGSVVFRTGGVPEVHDLAVDLESGEAWAVAPGSGEVVRLSPTGQVLRRLRGFEAPYGVAVDPD
jgi:DNA-binding beta-propeller fold protein YncE